MTLLLKLQEQKGKNDCDISQANNAGKSGK